MATNSSRQKMSRGKTSKGGWKSAEKKIMATGKSKEQAGKILGAAAQRAKNPSPAQKRVLKAQKGSKR